MAFFKDEFIDEVKASNDIVDVVSGYVNLKRHGSTFFGNCPFHREKTASFAVAPDKQIFHCFGCGAGGNVISFIMKAENLGFKESVEFLAERAKLEIPHDDYLEESQNELKIKDYHKSKMYEINKEAGRFFYQYIYKSDTAKRYITSRKLNINTIKKFGIGFAPNDNSLYKYLKSKGFKEDDMLATGLVGKSSSGILYDKFKDRLMFPIFDIRGRVVAFGGRTIVSSAEQKEKHIPKYVNSPENLIYKKGNHLYGLNIAKGTGNKLNKILVVEGYMDVVSPHSYGVTNVVASLGTALTQNQGKLLRQYADEVVLSYDSDEAGQNAIMRGIDILQSLNVVCKVLVMEGAKDPDEYVLKFGADKFRDLVDKSITAVEYKIRILKNRFDLKDTTGKIKFMNKMAEILAALPNNIERDIYVQKLSEELGVGKEAIVAEIEKVLFKDKTKQDKIIVSANTPENNSSTEKSDIEESIIYLLTLKNKSIFEKVKKYVLIDDFKDATNKAVLCKLYDAYSNNIMNEVDLTTIFDNEQELSKLTKIMMKENTSNDFEKVTDEVLGFFNKQKNENRKLELLKLMKETTDEELLKLYQSELREIIQQSTNKAL